MKKQSLFLGLAAAIAFSACNNDTSHNEDGTDTTISVRENTTTETYTTSKDTVYRDRPTAGQRLDTAWSDVKDAGREAGRDIKSAAEDVGDAAKKGARKAEEKTKEVRDDIKRKD